MSLFFGPFQFFHLNFHCLCRWLRKMSSLGQSFFDSTTHIQISPQMP